MKNVLISALQQDAALHQAGGIVLYGTDAGFAPEYDRRAELRLLEAAIGWPAVLASMTTSPAGLFGEGELRGRIAPGFVADIVAIGGDPGEDVMRMADVRKVMIGGEVVFDAAALAPVDATGNAVRTGVLTARGVNYP